MADPDASGGAKAVAVGKAALAVAGDVTLVGGNALARAVRAGDLEEIGLATKLVGKTGYRGSRIYGLRNAAGNAFGTDEHGFYFAVDKAGHMLHIGPWKW